MKTLKDLIADLGGKDNRFGVLSESNTRQLTVIARNSDVAVGDLFLMPCNRGQERIYVFRTTQYANIMNRTLEMNDVARNKLTMPDSYMAKDLTDETLLQLDGIVVGYAERESTGWIFHKPRRLPEHLTEVYKVTDDRKVAEVVNTILRSQLGEGGLYIGDLLAGESRLKDVPVYLPPYALSHHLGVFGRTGCGKSNSLMVFLRSIMGHNQKVVAGETDGPPCSILAIDPHDEFQTWHSKVGGADGIRGIVNGYSAEEQKALAEPFYYLTAREVDETKTPLERSLKISLGDITPDDLGSVVEMTDQQMSFANLFYSNEGEEWISGGAGLNISTADAINDIDDYNSFHIGTIEGVMRRLSFTRSGANRIFTKLDQGAGKNYESTLPEIICGMERGRVLTVDTTLMSEMEQFLLMTIVARVLFSLRKALRSAGTVDRLEKEIRSSLGGDEKGLGGMKSLADELVERLESGELPYTDGDTLLQPDQLPFINVVIEEAPSVLNPQRLRFGSVFRDISRQGRKFGIGLTVISQQVTAIDEGILTQINTELIMALGNEQERNSAIKNASADLTGFERELQVMGKGQTIATASYRDIPLPVQAPNYDEI
jgi:uncharacterized protein